MIDKNLRYVFANESAIIMNGITLEEHIGKSIFYVLGKSAEIIEPIIKKIFKTGEAFLEQEIDLEVASRPGEISSLIVSFFPILNAEQKPEWIGGSMVDITDRKQAENRIQRELDEKEVLLKEVHHRVRNNLQIIKSLLNLQAQKTQNKEFRVSANEFISRIHSMALVHDYLYKSGSFSEIDFKPYIEALATNVLDVYSARGHISLKLKIKSIVISLNQAIPCGLIINELLTNAVKYAFTNKQKGQITVSFEILADSHFELVVSDNGVGMPENVDLEDPKTLGIHLVKILAQQIKGTAFFSSANGTKVSIRFPQIGK